MMLNIKLPLLLSLLLFSSNILAENAVATFAGGCFWCMEPPFDKLEGVISTTSGYMGGHTENPTYKQVSSGNTGHAEVVQVIYDPQKVKYQQLLDVFWRQINPTTPDQQFADIGTQYRSEIFYHTPEQQQLAIASKQQLIDSKRFFQPIVTPISAASTFYQAEQYHQNYYKENAYRYKFYRTRSGRDQYLDRIWGKGNH